MPQLWQYREQIEEFLQKLNVSSDIIAYYEKITDSVKDLDFTSIEEPQVSFKRKRGAEDQMERSLKMRKLNVESIDNIEVAASKKLTITTPIGEFQPLELSDIVINNLLSINLPIVTVPFGTIDYAMFTNTLMKTVSMTDLPVEDMRQLQRFLNPLPQRAELTQNQDLIQDSIDSSQSDSKEIKGQISQLVKDFKAKATFLEREEKLELADMTWNQVLDAEIDVNREGEEAIILRTRILIDMVSSAQSPSEWREQLVSHLKERLDLRYNIAMQWLYHEYVKWVESNYKNNNNPLENPLEMPNDTSYMTLYESLLEHIIEISRSIADTNDPAYSLFQDFVIESPVITPKTIQFAHKYVLSTKKEIAKIKLGLSTLRDLVLYRDSVRNDCLQALLQYSVSNYNEARENSVVLIRNQLYTHEDLSQIIEEFAYKKLLLLTNDTPPEQEEFTFIKDIEEQEEKMEEIEEEEMKEDEFEEEEFEEDEEMVNATQTANTNENELDQNELGEEEMKEEKQIEWTSVTARQYSLLFVALCTKKHELLYSLVDVYTRTPGLITDEPKATLLTQLDQLIRKIKNESRVVLDFLITYYKIQTDSEEIRKEKDFLALRFVDILLESSGESISLDIIKTIKAMFFQRSEEDRDARLLRHIITTLSSEEIIYSLPWILMIPEEKLVHEILASTWKFQSSNSNPITPLVLLVELHKLKETSQLPLKRIVGSILYCLKQKTIFNSELIGNALAILIDLPETPAPLMRTIIECLLSNIQTRFIHNSLKVLIEQKKIYTKDILWEGLKRLFEITSGDLIYEAMFYLPQDKLKEALFLKKSGKIIFDFVVDYFKKYEGKRTSAEFLNAQHIVHEILKEKQNKELESVEEKTNHDEMNDEAEA